ncbi:hypothetical protein BOX15_Mlig026128g2, partial [Macrostomum lignano]
VERLTRQLSSERFERERLASELRRSGGGSGGGGGGGGAGLYGSHGALYRPDSRGNASPSRTGILKSPTPRSHSPSAGRYD